MSKSYVFQYGSAARYFFFRLPGQRATPSGLITGSNIIAFKLVQYLAYHTHLMFRVHVEMRSY